MDLLDWIRRNPSPEPWSEGDNITWNEPEFSERMLIDAESYKIKTHASSLQSYTQDQYQRILEKGGFKNIQHYPSLTGTETEDTYGLIAVTAIK